MTWTDLATVNALLNGLTTLLLLRGWWLIRRQRRDEHRRTMVAALISSALFLICYLVYHYMVGSVKFTGQGPVRAVYFTILLTHTVLAAAVPFLALRMAWLGFKERYVEHRRLGRWAMPIWLYVSFTGVVVYLMLYQIRW